MYCTSPQAIDGGGEVMNTKKMVLFGGAAVLVGGAVVYLLGVFPPGLSRVGLGAIGKRQVYRAEQPADATVNPGSAPVAVQATLQKIKNHQIPIMQNGQMFIVNNGYSYFYMNGSLVGLTAAQANSLQTGHVVAFQNGSAMLQSGLVTFLTPAQAVALNTNVQSNLNTNAAAAVSTNVQSGLTNHEASALNTNAYSYLNTNLQTGVSFMLNNGVTYFLQNGVVYNVTNGMTALSPTQLNSLNTNMNAQLNTNLGSNLQY
jgi:hypothetical protein